MNVIDLTDSISTRKRKREDDEETTSSPKHPLLDSICNRFQQNHAQRQSKMKELQTKREAELAHSRYIKQSVAHPGELMRANQAVKYWVKRNGVRDAPILGSVSTNRQTRSPLSSRLNNQSQRRPQSTNHSSRYESPRRERVKKDQTTGNVVTNSRDENSKKDQAKNSRSSSYSSSTLPVDLTDSDDENSPSLASLINEKDVITIGDNSVNDSVVEILDLSNNSSPQLSSKRTPEKQKKYVTRQTPKHVCMILNCEAVFSSEGALGQHRNLFRHSPCNPCLKEIDCKLLPDPVCFMCPQCDLEFEVVDKCRQHMKAAGHMTFYPPLSISCYMCAHCLYVFSNYQTCWQHIEESRHTDICYPFIDDQRSSGGDGIGPVPVVEEFIQDFIRKCHRVPYRLECLECSLNINTSAKLRHHYLETNNQHIVSVFADTTLVDVLAEYLAGYSCDICHRLFNGGMKELAKHQCADGIIGTIIENNTKSFTEFIKRCALTVIKSEERSEATSFFPKAGPSRESGRTTPRKRNKNISIIEICESPIAVSDDEHELTEGLSAGVAISSKSRNENLSTSTITNKSDKSPNKKSIKYKNCKLLEEKNSVSQVEDTQNNECHTVTENQRKKTRWDQTDRAAKEKQIDKRLDQSEGCGNEKQNSGNSSVAEMKSPASTSHSVPNVSCHQTSVPQSTQPPIITSIIRSIPLPPQQPIPPTPLLYLNIPGVPGPNQHIPHNRNPQNFYCHPPPRQTATVNMHFGQSVAGNTRYSLRNQNRNDASNSTLKPFQGIRIGTASTSSSSQPAYQQDQQVTGPSHIADTQDKINDGQSLKRDRSRSPVIGENSLISVENLMTKTNIIFLDLDNWPSFFSKLPRVLPDGTFVWGFFGGRNVWREPYKCYIFKQMKQQRQFYLNEQCGFTKDAADFAIVLTVGKMDVLLPTQVSFTILSGDKGFCEVERQMKLSKRKAVVINPHLAEQFSTEMIYTMVTSVTDT